MAQPAAAAAASFEGAWLIARHLPKTELHLHLDGSLPRKLPPSLLHPQRRPVPPSLAQTISAPLRCVR